jgi:hypothetical protein
MCVVTKLKNKNSYSISNSSIPSNRYSFFNGLDFLRTKRGLKITIEFVIDQEHIGAEYIDHDPNNFFKIIYFQIM